jgi:hypothetical protein
VISSVAGTGKIYDPAFNASLREEMFGRVDFTIGLRTFKPCDDLIVTHGLQPPSDQTIKLLPSQGAIETGPWSVSVQHREYGLTLIHRPDDPESGLDGVHTVPDTRIDNSISYSTISRSVSKGDSSIFVSIENDHNLAAVIGENLETGNPTYLWIGHECVAARGLSIVGDEYDIDEGEGIRREGERTFSVPALTRIDEFNETFGTRFSDEEFDTIGGLVIQALGHMPARNETATIDKFEFLVINADTLYSPMPNIAGMYEFFLHKNSTASLLVMMQELA